MIEVYHSMNKKWEATVKKVSDNSVVDISTAELTFCVKKIKIDPDYVAEITRKNTAAKGESSTEIVFETDGTDGVYQVTLVSANTSDLDFGLYFYSVEMVLSGEPCIIADGVFEILAHAC